MKLHRIKAGKYRTEEGLAVQKMDGRWYVLDDQQRVLFKRNTLADVRKVLGNKDIANVIYHTEHIEPEQPKFKLRWRQEPFDQD